MNNNITRRNIVKGSAWAIPAVAATTTVPAYAASCHCQYTATVVMDAKLIGVYTAEGTPMPLGRGTTIARRSYYNLGSLPANPSFDPLRQPYMDWEITATVTDVQLIKGDNGICLNPEDLELTVSLEPYNNGTMALPGGGGGGSATVLAYEGKAGEAKLNPTNYPGSPLGSYRTTGKYLGTTAGLGGFNRAGLITQNNCATTALGGGNACSYNAFFRHVGPGKLFIGQVYSRFLLKKGQSATISLRSRVMDRVSLTGTDCSPMPQAWTSSVYTPQVRVAPLPTTVNRKDTSQPIEACVTVQTTVGGDQPFFRGGTTCPDPASSATPGSSTGGVSAGGVSGFRSATSADEAPDMPGATLGTMPLDVPDMSEFEETEPASS